MKFQVQQYRLYRELVYAEPNHVSLKEQTEWPRVIHIPSFFVLSSMHFRTSPCMDLLSMCSNPAANARTDSN